VSPQTSAALCCQPPNPTALRTCLPNPRDDSAFLCSQVPSSSSILIGHPSFDVPIGVLSIFSLDSSANPRPVQSTVTIVALCRLLCECMWPSPGPRSRKPPALARPA